MASEKRQNPRTDLAVEIDWRFHGVARKGRLSNLSRQGCCLEMSGQAVAPGDRIALSPSKLLVLPATVAWIDGARAGLTFASPMIGSMLGQFFANQFRPEADLTGQA